MLPKCQPLPPGAFSQRTKPSALSAQRHGSRFPEGCKGSTGGGGETNPRGCRGRKFPIDVKKVAEIGRRGPGQGCEALHLLGQAPPALSSGRRRGTGQMGDIYCFKLSPLLSSPCQEVFEDRKYRGNFVSGVNKNLQVARLLRARFSAQAPAGSRQEIEPERAGGGERAGPGPTAIGQRLVSDCRESWYAGAGKTPVPTSMFVEECV